MDSRDSSAKNTPSEKSPGMSAQLLANVKSMRAVRQKAFGAADSLLIDKIALPAKPAGEHVLIKVKSSALNRADLLMRQGRYPNQGGKILDLGLEVSGHDVETDQPVMALLKGGGYSEYVYAPRAQVMPVPSNIDVGQAAAIPEVWLTAWQLLTFVANLSPIDPTEDKYILIHGGASGVGTAAIQMASKILNYKVIATASSAEKLEATKQYGATHAINYKETPNWDQKIKELTNNKGANVILDCVGGGSYVEKNLSAISVDGKWVFYGLLGGTKIPENMSAKFLALILGKRISLLGTTLNARSNEYKADLVTDFATRVLPKFDDKTLVPVVDKVFPIEEVTEAHQYMETNANIGKILLQIDPVD